MKVRFNIDGPPVPKQRPRFDPRTRRTYTAKRTRAYERSCAQVASTVATQLGAKREVFASSRISATFEVYMHDRRPRDVDNCAKSVLDGIVKSGLIRDDRQVDELIVRRHLDRERPRVEVVLKVMG